MTRVWRGAAAGLVRALAAGLSLALAVPAVLQAEGTVTDVTRQVDETGALMPRAGAPALVQADAPVGPVNGRAATAADKGETTSLDYDEWEKTAKRAEDLIANPDSTSVELEHLRAQLVDWRAALLGAQSANSARISTLRTQIAALGPAPAEGVTEADEIAQRRRELTEQLVKLQAPGLTAEEAYSRADGLIREIDRVLRERQTAELLTLWPSPLNPANWAEALIGLTDTGMRLWDETATKWQNRIARNALIRNLPAILTFALIAMGLIVFARRWVGIWAQRLQDRASERGRRIAALALSLGELILPTAGMVLATAALDLTSMAGVIGTQIVDEIPRIALPAIIASWLAGRVFPHGAAAGPLNLTAERRAEARYNAILMGALIGLDRLRAAAMDSQSYSEGTSSVTSYPGLALAGLLLFRMGQLLRRHAANTAQQTDSQSYGTRLLGLLGQAVMVVGIAGPLAGAVGYVQGAAALVYPAIVTLGLIGLVLIIQDLFEQVYSIVMRVEGDPGEALVPVLANFAIAIAAMPFLALVWGAREADLSELWTRIGEGFSVGETRISPSNFLILAVVFGLGYGLTRMFQGGLKSSILPRTSLDQGGQNAVVSGVGYAGVFLSALIAINAAGIDLSSLAIVAGALSVGIGFGLQNIVSNFVSGLILLIERPVSEGDWIEVGNTQGIVKAISVRATRIQTFERSDVIVPNSDLISGQVTNWTRFNRSGRLIVPVGVAFGTDTRKVERVLREIAEAQPLAILNPPPLIAFMGFGADSMNFEIRMILRDVNFSLAVRTEINHQIIERFGAEGIEIPFTQTDVYLRNVEALGLALRGLQVPPAHGPAPHPAEPTAAAPQDKPA